MKISMMAAAFAVAFAVVGCKYDKAGADGQGDGSASDAASVAGIDTTVDTVDADAATIDLDSVGEQRFEDYTKCDDVSLEPVYFTFDSTVVPQGELVKIDAVVQHLNDNSDRVVVLEGNCDERGSSEYNLSLGAKRADIVCSALVQSGIAANRIQCRSNGEEKPASAGHTEADWSLNRRCEFSIYKR